MPDFQQAVGVYNALGVPGEAAFFSPTRAAPFILKSADVSQVNKIAFAYTARSFGNPEPNTAASPVAGVARVGGTGQFVGLLCNPKEYPSNGTALGGPLASTLIVPDGIVGSMMQMGYIFAQLPGPATPGVLS